MDLLCINPVSIGILFSLNKVTEGLAGFALSGMTDRLGRRKSTIIFLGVNFASQALVIFNASYTARLIAFIGLGISNIKNSVAYVWLFEMVESNSKPVVCTFVNVLDTFTMVVIGFYLFFVSIEWFPLYMGTLSVTGCALLLIIMFMPESPKWLLITRSQKEAIKQFNYIGKFNRSPFTIPANAKFVEAQVARNQDNSDDESDCYNVSISHNRVAKELANL